MFIDLFILYIYIYIMIYFISFFKIRTKIRDIFYNDATKAPVMSSSLFHIFFSLSLVGHIHIIFILTRTQYGVRRRSTEYSGVYCTSSTPSTGVGVLPVVHTSIVLLYSILPVAAYPAIMSVWKKAALVPPLLFALWLLTDEEKTLLHNRHHLAVWTALSRHPPSLRVFRALLELSLLLFGASLSLHVWTRTVGTRVIGMLLFQPPADNDSASARASASQPTATGPRTYQLLSVLDDHADVDFAAGTLELEDDYDSDEEVERLDATPAPEPPSPSASSVCSASLDLLVLVLICLFLFTLSSAEGGRYIDGVPDALTPLQSLANVAAPIFPLVLFLATLAFTLLPWKRRRHFWIVLSHTIGAPFHHVTFRDGFLGDILTSSVRPMQDLCFTSFYILSGLQGWWTQSYSIDEAATPIEHSWILRTVLLPACMASPLWWRFLQNLRQAHDAKQRWPFLGNALKYLLAAEVAMFGVFQPNIKKSAIFIMAFVGATLYQVWWDVFMDWELLHVKSGKVALRSKRLYPYKTVYWTIMVINFLLRFCWTLSFMPQRYLTKAGVLQNVFVGDVSKIIGPAIASAEIIRRTLWGFLRFELEAIKSCSQEDTVKMQLQRCSDRVEEEEEGMELHDMTPMKRAAIAPFDLPTDMSANTDLAIVRELVIWATIFCSGGMLAAAHRQTY
jgi:hypothetical protein